MNSILPINVDDVLSGRVESARLEFTPTWDPKGNASQILKTLSAFANDLQNLNGGYVVIGVEERDGVAVRPVRGVPPDTLDSIQKEVQGQCNRLDPVYVPIFCPVRVDDRHVLVLWAPPSDIRPHQAPDGEKGERKYYVRIGSETVEARGDVLRQLVEQTARVPFDDRLNREASSEDLRITLVREFLRDIASDALAEPSSERIYASMRITRPVNGHAAPTNAGLLFFSEDPRRWFRGAKIEVAQFQDGAGGNTLEDQVYSGPLHHHVRQCLASLQNLTTTRILKRGFETRRWVDYPSQALREAIVNAVYHRSYEPGFPDPTKVHIYPDRLEVISYPGPVQGVELIHLVGEIPPPPVPSRNRQIGELLKELRLAEARGKGMARIFRSMRENGSPEPHIDFDSGRTYFRVTLPAHPEHGTFGATRLVRRRKPTVHSM